MKKPKHSEDYQKLYAFATAWVKTQIRPFTSEDLKQDYFKAGNSVNNPNCFGNVFKALSSDNAIKKADSTAKATMPNAHGRFLNVWISAEYSLSQSNKRLLPKTEQMSLL